MKKKNVLVVGMGDFSFGRERRAVRTLKHIGHARFHFLISKYEDGNVSKLLNENGFAYEHVPFGYFGWAHITWLLITLAQIPWLYVRFIAAYFRKKCDTILILSMHPLINAFLPIIMLKYFRAADIVFYFGDIPANNRIHHWLAKIINRLTNRIIANSHAVKRGLARISINEKNIQVIYNGVALNDFLGVRQKLFRQMFGWNSQTVLIGYVGQFSENKGIWDFVKAAEMAHRNEKDCCFLMIGKSDGQNRCQQELLQYVNSKGLGDYFAFTGRIDDIEEAYAGLDIVVIPSRFEDPAPNVCIEAMAAGMPVVATRVGGIPELVADGETGFLVEKENPEQIAECILRLARDAQLREKMGRTGRERAGRFFDIRKNARNVEEVILNS